MKKRSSLFAILFALVLGVSALSFAACGHVHEYGDWQIVTAPTAEAAGSAHRDCKDKDAGEDLNLPVLTDATFWKESTTPATHTAVGSAVYTAKDYAGITVTTTLPKLTEHTYGAWTVTSEPTETAEGKASRSCTAEDDTQELDLKVLTDATFWNVSTTPATHIADGSAVYTAKDYAGITVTVTLTKTPHTWNAWVITVDPTESGKGKIERTCSKNDGGKEELDLEPLSDDTFWTVGETTPPTCDTPGSTPYTCEYVEYAVHTPAAHTYGDWTITAEPTLTTGGKASRECVVETCPAPDKGVEETDIPALSDTTVWKKEIKTQATHETSGTIEYTSVYGTVTTTYSIEAYAQRDYYSLMFDFSDGRINRKVNPDTTWGTSAMTVDDDGVGTCGSYPFQGTTTIAYSDKTTSTVSLHTVGRDGTSTYDYTGVIDEESGIILVFYGSSRIVLLTPYTRIVNEEKWNSETEEKYYVDVIHAQNAATASVWGNVVNYHFVLDYDYETGKKLTAYITDGTNATFGVSFENEDGTVAAGDCYGGYAFIKNSDGETIKNFGYNGTAMVELDSLYGSYTGSLDGADATLKFNGMGGVSDGTLSGTYEKVGDNVDVFLGGAYYCVTISGSAFTAEMVSVTIEFSTEYGTLEKTSEMYDVKIAIDLPIPEYDGNDFIFIGWYEDGDFTTKVTGKYTPTVNATLYARWAKSTTFNLHVDEEDVRTVYYAAGEELNALLPELTYNLRTNSAFAGWYYDADFENALDEEVFVPESESDVPYDIYVKWTPLGTWTISQEGTYHFVYDAASGEWKSNNQGQKSSDAVMYIIADGDDVRVSFTYGSSSEGGSDYIEIRTYTVYNGNNTLKPKVDGSRTGYDNIVWTNYNETLNKGNLVKITYHKDSSVDAGTDTAYIKNLMINGRAITVNGTFDIYGGTYTCEGEDDLELSGFGTYTWGEKTGRYIVEEGSVGLYVEGEETEYYDIALSGKTYTATRTQVELTLVYPEATQIENVTETVYKNVAYALPETVEKDGFKFRGWYTDAEFTGSAITEIAPSENTSVYAKMEAAITVTVVYNNGMGDGSVEGKFAGDAITLEFPDPANDLYPEAWYTTSTFDEGSEWTSGTVATGDITIYLKWKEPFALMGEYKGFEFDSSSLSTTVKPLSIDAYGNFTGALSYSATSISNGTVEYDETTNTGFLVFGSYRRFFHYDTVSHTLVTTYGNSSNTTNLGTDLHVYTLVGADATVTATSSKYVTWDSNASKLGNMTIGDEEKLFFIYNQKVYGGVTVSATFAGEAIATMSQSTYKVKGAILTVTRGSDTWAFGYNGTTFAVSDGNHGTYTSGGENPVYYNGAGVVVIGGEAFDLTAKEGTDNTFTASGATATYTVTIDTENKTYTAQEDKVTVTYDFGTLEASLDDVEVFRGKSYSLPAKGPEVGGFVFRGWYDNAAFTGSAKTSITVSTDTTVYAKYDKAITITVVYGNGLPNDTITDKFANDNVTIALPTKGQDGTENAELYPFGWYTSSDFNPDSAWTSGSSFTDDVTLYCKWDTAHALAGTYKGWEAYNGKWQSTSSITITVDVFGKVTGSTSGTIGDYDEKTGYFTIKNGTNSRVGYYDSVGNTILMGFSDNQSTFDNDVYILFGGVDTLPKNYSSAGNAAMWKTINNNCTDYIVYTVANEGAANETVQFIYREATKVYANVDVKINGVAATKTTLKDATTEGYVLEISRGGVTIFKGKYDGTTFVGSDGKQGTYTGTGAVASIDVDGYGLVTVGENTVAYTLDGNKITFVLNNKMMVVELGDGMTCAQVQDGYAGTYTLPENAGTVTLDGLGGAGEGATYVVNGTTLTVYTAGKATAYGIEAGSTQLLGKSIFAGLTFTSKNQTLVFEDGVNIVGTMTSTTWPRIEYEFTGEYDKATNVVTLTITSESVRYGFVGETITAAVSNGQIQFTSSFKYDNVVDINGDVATCADFSL